MSSLRALALSLALAATLPPAGRAGEPSDHERARAALQAGEVQPLAALLTQLQRTHPGQVLAIELEREHGRWIYEIKQLRPDGRLVKLEVDARSGEVLATRRKDRRDPERAR